MQSATDCHALGAPAEVRVGVRARRDQDLEISVSRGTPEFIRCVVEDLDERLRSRFSTTRTIGSGESVRFFRVDGDGSAEVHLQVESPEARARRIEEEEQREYEYEDEERYED